MACLVGHLDICMLLLDRGADPRAKKPGIYWGSTPLDCAISRDKHDVAFLMRNFAQPAPEDSLIMAVAMMQHLVVYHEVNGTQIMIDFYAYLQANLAQDV